MHVNYGDVDGDENAELSKILKLEKSRMQDTHLN